MPRKKMSKRGRPKGSVNKQKKKAGIPLGDSVALFTLLYERLNNLEARLNAAISDTSVGFKTLEEMMLRKVPGCREEVVNSIQEQVVVERSSATEELGAKRKRGRPKKQVVAEAVIPEPTVSSLPFDRDQSVNADILI